MKIEPKYYFLTLGFYSLLLFNLNAKTLILAFFAFFLLIWAVGKNFRTALLFTYLASLPFPTGKTFTTVFVPAEALNIPYRSRGIEAILTIAVKEILLAAMVFFLIRDLFKGDRRVIKLDWLAFLLLMYFFAVVVASFLGSIYPNTSLMFSLYELRPLVFYLYLRRVLQDKEPVLPAFLAIVAAAVMLEFGLAVLQLASGIQLGPSWQYTRSFLPEVDPELGQFVFRPVGTFFHATDLTHHTLSRILIFVPFLFATGGGQNSFPNKAGAWTFFLALATIIFTLGRGAWIAVALTILAFLFIAEKKWGLRLQLARLAQKIILAGLPIVVLLLIFFIAPRIINTLDFFGTSGGAATRLKQMLISWELIKKNPFFGVGLEMDVFSSYLVSPDFERNVFREFPEPV
ncbi:MAG: O-antigen ligase family protein, partial [Patescibacteria group bacterium]